MKRDKVINYSSKTATNDTILNTIVNNSDTDKNLLAGEIAVVTTEKNRAEGIENSLRTDVDSKVSGITASDTSITVDNTTTTNPKLKVTLSQTDGNRLALNADGLYVTNTIDCGTF